MAREIRFLPRHTAAASAPSPGCDATPEAWAMLSPRDTIGAARPKVRQLALPILTHNGTSRSCNARSHGDARERNLAARLNRRRRSVHGWDTPCAQSLHRLVIDTAACWRALQPCTRRSMFDRWSSPLLVDPLTAKRASSARSPCSAFLDVGAMRFHRLSR
jgi:hypothetical protein